MTNAPEMIVRGIPMTLINKIWAAARAQPEACAPAIYAAQVKRAVASKYLTQREVIDLVYDLDPRLLSLSHNEIVTLAELVDVLPEIIYLRPTTLDEDAEGVACYTVGDILFLLIMLERMGFRTDPQPLALALSGRLDENKLLDRGELIALRWPRDRLPSESLVFSLGDKTGHIGAVAEFESHDGFTIHAWVDNKGEAFHLEFRPPSLAT